MPTDIFDIVADKQPQAPIPSGDAPPSGSSSDIFDLVSAKSPVTPLFTGNPFRNRRQLTQRASGVRVTPLATEKTRREAPFEPSMSPSGLVGRGVTQAGAGMQQIGRGEYLKGATNTIEGLGTTVAPFVGPVGLINAPLATATGLAYGGAASWLTKNMMKDYGATEDEAALGGTASGLINGGIAGGMAANAAKTPPVPSEYPEAPFLRVVRPKPAQQDALETWAAAAPELLATRDQSGLPLAEVAKSWQGPQGSFTKHLVEVVGPAAKERFWQTYDQMAAPLRGRLRLDGTSMAEAVKGAVGDDPISGPISKYSSELIAAYKGKVIPLAKAEADLHKLNKMLYGFYNKSPSAANVALAQDANDVAALEAMAKNIRQQIYYGLDRENNGTLAADAMRKYGQISEAVDSIASLKNEAIQGVTPSLSHRAAQLGIAGAQAKAGYTGGAMNRLKNVFSGEDTIDQALLKAFQGYKGQRAPIMTPAPPAESPETILRRAGVPQRLKTEDLANLIAYQGPVKSAQESAQAMEAGILPADWLPSGLSMKSAEQSAQTLGMSPNWRFPASRQIAAPQGPVGVSGTTVPDTRGQIRGLVNREQSGPMLLPPPSPGVPPQGFAQGPGNIGFGSQHSQVQGGQFNLPRQMPVPNRPGQGAPPLVQQGGPFTPEVIAQYALHNRITYVQALEQLNVGGAQARPSR